MTFDLIGLLATNHVIAYISMTYRSLERTGHYLCRGGREVAISDELEGVGGGGAGRFYKEVWGVSSLITRLIFQILFLLFLPVI